MKMRYKYLYSSNGRMYWESVQRLPGDSRVEQVNCNWDWFWRFQNVRA